MCNDMEMSFIGTGSMITNEKESIKYTAVRYGDRHTEPALTNIFKKMYF